MEEKLLPGVVTRKQERRYLRLKKWTLSSISTLLALHLLSNHYNPDPISYLSHSPKPLKYSGEHITWEPCGDLHDRPLECSSIQVPIDQFATEKPNPTSSKRERNPNLLLNPGGPGASGFEFLYSRGDQLKTILGSGFHFLTFDPRGSHNRARDAAADSPEIYAWARNFAKACADTMGDYAPYINTPQTAADMNSILDAVGREDMIYWGFSYGTLLGQTYAGLFPERSRRVVIDRVVDQFVWYEGVGESDELIDTDKKNCTELHEIVLSFMDNLRNNPLDIYINNTVYGILTYEKVWYNGVFAALYKPPLWSSLAENLYSFIQGNATPAFLAYNTDHGLNDESNEFVTLNDGRTGPAHWPQGKDELLTQITPWLNQSLFSASFLTKYYQKQQWTVPRMHPYVPRRDVETAHPLLILSTTYDPVCPLASARLGNEAFSGSRVVEVEGYGHCSVAVASICAAQHLRAFLYEGKLPDGYTRCKVDSVYFGKPDENGRVAAKADFEDPEDQKIHLAQLELMAGWEFAKPILW
ncbi:Alpha/beta hydrolase fold-1 [Penicillium cf. griseofulvum]|uniref:Alpha/beta hydrolase fold-1 n=1 Tax=Penicillium cf. griseofulvum TaxID=2972120 RepID=A0A9W9M3Z9_9EURO|nr:Alpha/beta hydrolase fold-1 [Penicillium cf. griseofulvum]